MNGLLLVAASVNLGLVAFIAASGAGSHARTIGLHVPGIHRDQRTVDCAIDTHVRPMDQLAPLLVEGVWNDSDAVHDRLWVDVVH